MSREISYSEWRELGIKQGNSIDDLVTHVRMQGHRIQIEGAEGEVDIDIYIEEEGIDVRIGDVQLLVKGSKLHVIQRHPSYPIRRWSVLWEGTLVK